MACNNTKFKLFKQKFEKSGKIGGKSKAGKSPCVGKGVEAQTLCDTAVATLALNERELHHQTGKMKEKEAKEEKKNEKMKKPY